jgi:hypothetical protein
MVHKARINPGCNPSHWRHSPGLHSFGRPLLPTLGASGPSCWSPNRDSTAAALPAGGRVPTLGGAGPEGGVSGPLGGDCGCLVGVPSVRPAEVLSPTTDGPGLSSTGFCTAGDGADTSCPRRHASPTTADSSPAGAGPTANRHSPDGMRGRVGASTTRALGPEPAADVACSCR